MKSGLAAFAGLAVLALGGCQGGPTSVKGKVIRGDISFVVAVDASDPRLKGEGLAGAEVQVTAVSARGAALLAEGKSDANGNLKLSVRDTEALLRPAEFSAELDGYTRTSAEMSIPPGDKLILIMLRPSSTGTAK